MRKKMFGFFDFLRTQGLYTFIITERQQGENAELQGNEGFIADGIINLGLDRRNGKIVRTMQIEKMRHVRHSMEKQAIDISAGAVTVMGPLFD
jgi:KaiC/GvpD/RAD55 family RecA-like ATPase